MLNIKRIISAAVVAAAAAGGILTFAGPEPPDCVVAGAITEKAPSGRAIFVQLRSNSYEHTAKVPNATKQSFEFKQVPPGRYKLKVLDTATELEFVLSPGQKKNLDLVVDTNRTVSMDVNFLRGRKKCSDEQLKACFYPHPETPFREPLPIKRNITTGELDLMGLEEGLYYLKVFELCDRSTLFTLRLERGRENVFNLQLNHPGTIRGKVVDEAGVPAQGVFVQASLVGEMFAEPERSGTEEPAASPRPGELQIVEYKALAVTDFEGKFMMGGLRHGVYSVSVDSGRGNPFVVEGFVEPGNEFPGNPNMLPCSPPASAKLTKEKPVAEVELRVKRCESSISGTVAHSNGAPMKAVPMFARPDSLNKGQGKPIVYQTKTDQSGRFHFANLPDDLYRLDISADGFPQAAVYNVKLAKRADLKLKFPRKDGLYSLRLALMSDGAPARGAQVSLVPREEGRLANATLQFKAGDDGVLNASGLYPGSYDLIVEGQCVLTPRIVELTGQAALVQSEATLRKPVKGVQVEVMCRKKISPNADFAAFLAQLESLNIAVFAKGCVSDVVNGAVLSGSANQYKICDLVDGEYDLYLVSSLGNLRVIRSNLRVSPGETVFVECSIDE